MTATAGDLDRDSADALLAEAESIAGTDPDAALRALDDLDRLGADATLEARAAGRYLRARLTAMGGDPSAALDLIGEARELWIAADDEVAAVRAGLGEMHVLDDLGRHRTAIEVGEAMIAALDGVDPDTATDPEVLRWLRAATLHNIGTARGFTGDHAGALASYTEAEGTWQRLGLEQEQATEQTNRGVELTAVGRADEALVELERAADTFARLDDELTVATVRGHRADALVRLGRYTEALEDYEHSRIRLERHGATTERARLTVRTAATYLLLELAEEAGELARQAIDACRAAGLDHDRAHADLITGDVALRQGRLDLAGVHLDAAVTGFAEVGDGLGQVDALLARSRLAAETGDAHGAGRDATAACRLADAADWAPASITARLALVDLAPDTPDARELLAEAQQRVATLPIPDLRYGVEWRSARQLRLAGRFDEARTVLDSTMSTLERVRGRLTDEALRRSFSSGRSHAQQELLRLALAGSDEDQVRGLLAADAASTQTLIEAIDGRTGGRRDAPDGDLDPSDHQLRATYTELLHSASQPQQHRRQLLRRIEQLERESKVARLRRRTTAVTSPPSPHGVGVGADETTASAAAISTPVVVFHELDGRVHALVRTPAGDHVHQALADTSAVVGLLAELDRHWELQQTRPELRERHGARLIEHTHGVLAQLHDLLLGPCREQLDRATGDELMIVPDGPLHRVPFAALVDRDRQLADRWTVTIAPSLEVARRLARGPIAPLPSSALVVGAGDEQIPNVETEIDDVARAYPGATRLRDEDASLQALREHARHADVIHLACHGLFRAGNPMYSSLRLGDGWTTANELAELELDGALVVSSSCESGRVGERGHGDESLGLPWALLAAGAAGVIVSLWRIDDAAAADLMREFHRRYASGTPAARALREAQLEARARRPHPFFWAPFIHVGGPPADTLRTPEEGTSP